ncbi:MAG: tetratricopeptide repeat protein [bacterium]|nr:tetratricopeptide repeat protein [bacterium]
MMKRLFCMAIILCMPALLFATMDNARMAERHYQAQEYKSAARLYENLNKQYPKNSDILYNLGTTLLQDGQLGAAVCNLKKARLYAPRDKNIRHNLELAESKIIDNPEGMTKNPVRIIGMPLKFLELNEQIGMLLFLATLLNVMWMMWTFTGKDEKLKAIVVLLLVVTGLYSAMFIANRVDALNSKEGVILPKKIGIKQGPLQSLPTVFYLHEGASVRILKHASLWTNIALENGFEGWIERKDLCGVN